MGTECFHHRRTNFHLEEQKTLNAANDLKLRAAKSDCKAQNKMCTSSCRPASGTTMRLEFSSSSKRDSPSLFSVSTASDVSLSIADKSQKARVRKASARYTDFGSPSQLLGAEEHSFGLFTRRGKTPETEQGRGRS